VRLAVLSDLHWTQSPATRAAWHNVYDFAGLAARLGRARAAGERARVDAVIACGDLTHAGDEASARAALERLSARAGRPVLAVAGNHDCLERDDQLERCLAGGTAMLTAAGVEVAGVRITGVAIARDAEPGTFRSTGGGELVGAGRVGLVVSHFPVISRAERLEERGLAYAGDLVDRHALHARLLGARPVVVLSGHIHARDSHACGNVLQLSAGALIEPPHEVAIVDVRVARAEIRVRRRAHVLGPAGARTDPVLAPADEAWTFGAGGWRPVPGAA
jgi:predicted phosphodiesterase